MDERFRRGKVFLDPRRSGKVARPASILFRPREFEHLEIRAMLNGDVAVSTTADVVDGNISSDAALAANPGPDGRISLREALAAADNTPSNSGAVNTINMPVGTYTITGQLQVGNSTNTFCTITGTGINSTIIQQTDGVNRVLEVDPGHVGGVEVDISKVAFTGGNTGGADGLLGGGAILASGNDALSLLNSTFSNNVSSADGGAIAMVGNGGTASLSVESCNFMNNSAQEAGGAIAEHDISSPTFAFNLLANNAAAAGGGAVEFLNERASPMIVVCTFTTNTATDSDGGAIYFSSASATAPDIEQSTFTGNQATADSAGGGRGGAVYFQGAGSLKTVNSTLANNSAQSSDAAGSGEGGAVYTGMGINSFTLNRILNNSAASGATLFANNTSSADDNWWGTNSGPATGDLAGATASKWMQLSAHPTSASVPAGNGLVISVDFHTDSVGQSVNATVMNGQPVAFSAIAGVIANADMTFGVQSSANAAYKAGTTMGAGSASATVDGQTVTIPITITAPATPGVVGRKLFYGGSAWDKAGTTGPFTPLPYSDDNAIAADKTAYLPGTGAATFASVSSYDRGVNGIMVDLQGAAADLSITQANITNDFAFKLGNNNSPNTWGAAPNPSTVTVRVGVGIGGSDRVELIWPSGSIKEEWLEVTVKATTNTSLAANDVFFFGNAVANSGNGDTASLSETNSVDELGARNNGKTLLNNIPITNIFDYNRDGLVNSVDSLLSRNNAQTLGATRYINIGSGGPFAPPPDTTSTVSGDSGVASALTNTSSSPSPSLAAIPAWIVNRFSHVDLNSGPVATYLEHLAEEDTAKSRAILVQLDYLADALNLDDTLLDSLLSKFQA
jgi:predicted outer membrane repeat protein